MASPEMSNDGFSDSASSTEGRSEAASVRSDVERLARGVEAADNGLRLAGFEVDHIAATNFSSWALRLPRTPTMGCEHRVMDALFTGWRYVSAGILARER